MGFFDDLTAIVQEVTSIKDDIITEMKAPLDSLTQTVTDISNDIKQDQ